MWVCLEGPWLISQVGWRPPCDFLDIFNLIVTLKEMQKPTPSQQGKQQSRIPTEKSSCLHSAKSATFTWYPMCGKYHIRTTCGSWLGKRQCVLSLIVNSTPARMHTHTHTHSAFGGQGSPGDAITQNTSNVMITFFPGSLPFTRVMFGKLGPSPVLTEGSGLQQYTCTHSLHVALTLLSILMKGATNTQEACLPVTSPNLTELSCACLMSCVC